MAKSNLKKRFVNEYKDKTITQKKYFRVHDEQFILWIENLMLEERMRYASPSDVASELSRLYGGAETSHMHKIRKLRIDVQGLREKALAKKTNSKTK